MFASSHSYSPAIADVRQKNQKRIGKNSKKLYARPKISQINWDFYRETPFSSRSNARAVGFQTKTDSQALELKYATIESK